MGETTKDPEERSSFKKWLLFAGVLLVLGAALYGFFWYKNAVALRNEAQDVLERAERYETLKQEIEEEKGRCEMFISQQEGDFGSFEYCQKFLQWTDDISGI